MAQIKKKLRQNEWHVNADNCYGMMKIMHGARETQEVKKKIPQCYRILFQRNPGTPSIKSLQVCKLVYHHIPIRLAKIEKNATVSVTQDMTELEHSK